LPATKKSAIFGLLRNRLAMRLASVMLLFVFVSFLSMPTVVSIMKWKSDTSVFFSLTEEELAHKELKAELRLEDFEFYPVFFKPSGAIIGAYSMRHDKICSTIFIPPPELI
jgi:hypothetical protein